MERRWSIPLIAGLVALLSVVLLSSSLGPVSGAIPNRTSGKFYVCINKRAGAVRIIDYPKVAGCPKGWRLRTWNAQGAPGAPGPQGAQGVQGPQGPAGPAGITKVALSFHTVTVDLPASTITSVVAPCPAGSKVVGGGFQGVEPTTAVRDSRPSSATAWLVRVHNAGSSADNLSAYAVCMATEPAAVIASLSPAAKKAIRQANKSTQKPRR